MVAEHLAWRACTTSKCSRNVPLSKCLTLRTMDVSLITLVCSFVLYMRARCMSCLADSQRLRYHLSKGTKEIFCNFDTYFSCGYLLHAKYFIRLLLRSAILFILLEINNQTILFIVIFVFFFFFLLPLRVFVFIHFLFDANFSSWDFISKERTVLSVYCLSLEYRLLVLSSPPASLFLYSIFFFHLTRFAEIFLANRW